MATYTAQQTFGWDRPCSPAVIAALMTSGSVVVELYVGTTWIPAYTFTATGVQSLWVGRGPFRVRPTGDATYGVQ